MGFKRTMRRAPVCLYAVLFVLLVPHLALSQAANSAAEYDIASVSIEGTHRVDADAVLAQIKKTSGRISTKDISEDTKIIYTTGFFEEVSAKVVDREGKRVLIYALVERPTVRKVFIKGNKEVTEKDLAEVLTFDAKRFFDRTKLSGLVHKAIALYQSRGFYDAAITFSVVPATANQVDLTFQVSEGAKFKISELRFNGLEQIESSDLIDTMQTKRYKWWSSWLLGTGRVNVEMLDNDKNLLRQYFLDHGFLDATISDARIEKEDEQRLLVVFDISEGGQYKVGTVSAKGDLIDSSVEKTVEGIETKSGKVFSATLVRKDSFTISDKFADRGFAFTNAVPNTDLRRAEQLVDIQFDVGRGPLTTVNRINVKGNTKTYDHVVRREMRVQEQELYSATKIRRSQEMLQRLGLFEEVTISPQPTAEKDKVDLDVNVREGRTGTFSVGVGYSTSDGALLNTHVSENNLFGTGRRLDFSVDVGTQRSNAILSLENPHLNDSLWSLGTDLFYTTWDYNDFNRQTEGAGITLGHPLEQVFGEDFQDVDFSIKYGIEGIDIRDVHYQDAAQLVVNSQGKTTASGITPRIVRNTINNPLNPTHGSRQSASIEVTGLGGDQEFFLLEARNTTYVPLVEREWGDIVFSYRGTLTYGENFSDEPFPLYKRFFPGGINSVRGYKTRTLGPTDYNDNAYGGSKEWINNFDLTFPLINSVGLKGVFFYDAGQAFDDHESIDVSKLRLACGTGIRWNSPMGPIRIELGFPVHRESGESSMQTMFSFGAPM